MKKGEKTKRRILEQGLKLFSSYGYEETALKDIAKNVNIKTPSIYAYFESKQDLFEQIVSFVIEDYLEFIEQQSYVIVNFPIEKKLYHVLVELNKYYYMNDKGSFLKRYWIYPPENFKELITAKNKKVEETIQDLVFSILKNNKENELIDEETIVISFTTILDGMLFYMMSSPYEEYERRLNTIWSVFWKGIRAS
ncbi:TetR/AcrR family transcriptional regulator [Lentibacillus sp. L22]|uniref:TetR/AcrR family transcriptional regulator n=1 Tax=Lentibacillus TaxID=175304 RepID=UPI0022B1C776|nr:TetR/AcrR family transcriptional regulator [Lentibacillus daqui]